MSWAIRITGPPGGGKTTVARAAAAALRSRGIAIEVLDLEEIRSVLSPMPAGADAEREIVSRAVAYMVTLLTRAGVRVLVDATSHAVSGADALHGDAVGPEAVVETQAGDLGAAVQEVVDVARRLERRAPRLKVRRPRRPVCD